MIGCLPIIKLVSMYRGFDVTLKNYIGNSNHAASGKTIVNEHKKIIKKQLNEFISNDGKIDGKKLEAHWFPQINADIFISHSHRDKDLAIGLAGWLFNNFKLIAFIDHTIWGYANSLLKIIDDKYCLNPKTSTYSYQKRNISTSHVHMMLSTALAKMVDQTECLFFLNTPNSVSTSKIISDSTTNSPWLYYEIAISKLVEKPLSKHTRRLISKSKAYSESLGYITEIDIKYPLGIEHFSKLTGTNLVNWRDEYYSDLPRIDHPLNKLYNLY